MTKEREDAQRRGKPGPKHWTLAERMGGLLPGDSRPEGILSFPIGAFYRGKAFPKIPSEMDSPEKREHFLNLSDEQKWALDFLTEELRDAVVRGDAEALEMIALAIKYRKKVIERNNSPSYSEDLELRLFNYALYWKYSDQGTKADGPDRNEAKKWVIDEMIKEDEAKTGIKMTEAQRKEKGAKLTKERPWTKSFNKLGYFGFYLRTGKAGAPRKF